ncbi:MAG: hypothetical protein E7406_08355 [Ruminococcaceae bacterium]|nr:hypothetical protein [Oscillospiraceae bacterium]
MKVRSVLLVCIILVSVFSCSMIGYFFGVTAARKDNIAQNLAQVKQNITPVKTDLTAINPVSGGKEAEETPAKSIKETFVLKEENGKIALYKKDSSGNEKLHSSYDVPIVFLPKDDREMLRKGIEFESLDEIVKFIEDYIG